MPQTWYEPVCTEQLPYSKKKKKKIKKKMSQVQPLTSRSPPDLKRNLYHSLQKVTFSLCMACTVYVYGICLKCYVAVDVSECLSRCGNMEILSVQERCAHTFLMVWNTEGTERSDCDFKSSFSLFFSLSLSLSVFLLFFFSLPTLSCSQKCAKQICINFKHVHRFSFLCLADFALGHWGKVMYDIMHSWCYCNDL